MTRSEAALAIAAGLLAAALALAIVWTVDAAGQTSEGDTSTSPEPGSPEPGSGLGLDDPRFGEYARHQQELAAEAEDEGSAGLSGVEDWPGSEFPWAF